MIASAEAEVFNLNSKPKTLLGFDYGSRRIGVAVGQSITDTASPLPTLKAKDGVPDWALIEKLVSEWKPDGFVVGLPFNMDGTQSKMASQALKFAKRLNGRFDIPCHTIDERLSSREAREISRRNAELAGKKYNDREKIDSLAAQLILETWLAEQ